MIQAILEKKIDRAASEFQDLLAKSKRKLLELEVMLSINEIRKGRLETFKTAGDLFCKLK